MAGDLVSKTTIVFWSKLKTSTFLDAGTKAVVNDCELEDYAPEGVPLYQLVDQQADDQNEFMKAYIDAHEKMINNGYNEADLIDAPSDEWATAK